MSKREPLRLDTHHYNHLDSLRWAMAGKTKNVVRKLARIKAIHEVTEDVRIAKNQKKDIFHDVEGWMEN